MKLQKETSKIETGGIQGTNTFSIKTTSAAFQLLSSGLYSNKIKAVIRELACNAHDAHVMVGNKSPLEIKLPNTLDTQFYVKDFGPGLTHDQVMRLYTTYFDSTKQDSNDFIGGFGVGSKSPFAYTDSFTVESRQNGKKRVYSAYVDEQQVPQIAYMGESDTDEPNGLTVGFPVKPTDFSKFVQEAKDVLMWFETKPVLKGTAEEIPDLDVIKISDTLSIPKSGAYTAKIKLGNVAYPLQKDASDLHEELSDEKIRWLINRKVIVEAPIGTISVAASREALSYDKATIKELKNIFTKEAAVCAAHVVKELNAIDTTNRAGIKEMYNYIHALGLSHFESSQTSIDKAVANKKINHLPLLNQLLIEAKAPPELLQKISASLTNHSIYSTPNMTLGRCRTSRAADIEYIDHNSNGYSYGISVQPVSDVIVIEKNLGKSTPLTPKAWRNIYSEHIANKYGHGRATVVIVEKQADADQSKYDADLNALLKTIGLSEAKKFTDYLNQDDLKKLDKLKSKAIPTLQCRSIASNRMITVSEGQNIFWCSEETRSTKVENEDGIRYMLDSFTDDIKLKDVMPYLGLPDSAKVVMVDKNDVAKIKTFKNATNLIEHIDKRFKSKEFQDHVSTIPNARRVVHSLMSKLADQNALADTNFKNTRIAHELQRIKDLPEADIRHACLEHLAKANITTLKTKYNIDTRSESFYSVFNEIEKNYPMLHAYVQQNRWGQLNFEHIAKYINACENVTPSVDTDMSM